MSFVSPRPSMYPKVKLRGTLRLRGNKAHCFLQDLGVMKCFVIPPNSKIEKKCNEIDCLTLAGFFFDKFSVVSRSKT